MNIRIITDSPSDISRKEGKNLNIDIVPLKININDKSYREGIDISIDEFYEMLEKSEELPTTSTPSPEDFLTYYKEAKELDQEVIVITLASSLSGTYQCARLAKDMLDYPKIHVIDSKQATLSQMLLVKYAVKLRDEGKTAKEIIDAVIDARDKVVLLAVVDTLDYLHKGGRLPKGVAVASNLLQLKPIVTLKDGSLSLAGQGRGLKGSIKSALNLINKFGPINPKMPVIFGHADGLEKCQVFKEKIDEEYQLKNSKVYPIGSVIGTHAGPGAVGIAFMRE